MIMSAYKKGLFKWEAISKARTYSRSQRITTEDNIQDWLTKVEEASAAAAAETFGCQGNKKKTGSASRQAGSALADTVVTDARLHDAAYAEAQDLLQQWVDDTIDTKVLDDVDDENYSPPQHKSRAEVRREWDHLLDLDNSSENMVMPSKTYADPYSILKKDDDEIVDSVLQTLLDKDLMQDDKKWKNVMDIDDDSHVKKPDPRVKMQLRHQQVKENRLKREKMKTEKMKEQQAKKEAHLKARKIVQKEEEEKLSRKRREEQQIQREMTRIRREMEEEKRKKDETKVREREDKERVAREAHAELVLERARQEEQQRSARRLAEEKHRLILHRMEELQAKEVADNYKLLQSSFSTWFAVVLERRLQYGKAKAMADWKLLLRTFNAWKSWIRNRRLDRETQYHEDMLKAEKRNKSLSVTHHHTSILRRCFAAWQIFVLQEQNEKSLALMQEKTKSKVAAFLEAAASSNQDHNGPIKSQSMDNIITESARRKVDSMFEKSEKKRPSRGQTTSRSEVTTSRSASSVKSRAVNKPREAWQLTKKHVKMTNGDLSQLDDDGDTAADGDSTQRSTSDTSKPRQKKFVVNSMEHRHAAQQKMLALQQKQLQEQQRLIEEMQYLQRQQLLQQQLAGQQVATETIPKLEAHLHQLQVEVVGGQRSSPEKKDRNGAVSNRSDVTAVTPLTSRTDLSGVTHASEKSDETTAVSSTISTNSKHTRFLKAMEDRAAERQRLKKEREEKRRKAEMARLAELEAAAQEQMQKEAEEKRQKAEAYREKKRQEKLLEEEKQRQLERLKQLSVAADAHRQRQLLKYTGWLPWRQLITMAKDKQTQAQHHYRLCLLKKVFVSWHEMVMVEVTRKKTLADKMYSYLITRRCFNNWRKAGEYMSIQEERAERHHRHRLLSRIVTAWTDFAAEEKVQGWHNERKAREHNIVRVQLTALRAWRRFPGIMHEEEDREKKRAEMRKKVASLIPDFAVSSSIQSTKDGDL